MFPGVHVLIGIVVRTAVIYAAVLLGVRLSGKREVGQMTPFDLTLLLLISNAVQNAMTGAGYFAPGRSSSPPQLFSSSIILSRSFPEAIVVSAN